MVFMQKCGPDHVKLYDKSVYDNGFHSIVGVKL